MSTKNNGDGGQRQTPSTRQPIKPEKMTNYEFWSLIVNIVTGVTTVIVVGIAVRQFFDHTQTDLAKAQIETLESQVKEMKNQFYLENTPFLTIPVFKQVRFKVNQPLMIIYGVANIGKLPTKIISSSSDVIFGDTTINLDVFRNHINTKANVDTSVIYIAPDSNPIVDQIFQHTIPMTREVVSEVNNNKLTLFFFGQIVYEHPQDNRRRKYFFVFEAMGAVSSGDLAMHLVFQENVNL